MYNISLTVNGTIYDLQVPARKRLVDILRYDLSLMGTHESCGTGDCGACTVILDGKAVNSCLVLAVEADGSVIETIEGLAKGEKLHPIQEAFLEEGAVQCGFCTPGMVMTAKALLEKNLNPSEEEIKRELAGNLCRCTGYERIIKAVSKAAKTMAAESCLDRRQK
ncbi:MAG: (2Fe-2S)-binding protein [Bacillota bacterium]